MTTPASVAYLCGAGPLIPDTTSDCPDRDRHTPAPTGYVDWHEWAGKMHRNGARQRRCPGCGRLVIWTTPNREVRWP